MSLDWTPEASGFNSSLNLSPGTQKRTLSRWPQQQQNEGLCYARCSSLRSLQGSADESLSWPNNALSVPPLDPARWDLAAMKLCILIVTRGRIAVETFKWWRCRSPLNVCVDGGVCDCPQSWKLFVTVVTQESLAPSPQRMEPRQQGQTESKWQAAEEKGGLSHQARPHNAISFMFSILLSFASAMLNAWNSAVSSVWPNNFSSSPPYWNVRSLAERKNVVCGSRDLGHLRQHADFSSANKKGNDCTQAVYTLK